MKLNINKEKAATPAKKQPAVPGPTPPPEADAANLEPWVLAVEAAGGLPDDYASWQRTCFALAAVGETGRSLFHRISCLSPKYDESETDEKFDEALKNGNGSVGPATFVHLCKEAGISLPKKQWRGDAKEVLKKTREAVDAAGLSISDAQVAIGVRAALNAKKDGRTDGGISVMLHAGLPIEAAEIIANEVRASSAILPITRRPTRDDIIGQLGTLWTIYFDPSSGIYYRGQPGENDPAEWQRFDSRSPIINDFLLELERKGLNTDKRTLLEAIESSYCYREINYLTARLDYLAARWDGKNYLAQLTATAATDDDALFTVLFKKWLLNTIAQAYCNSPGCRNEHALVFVSAQQGVGKTSFFAGLTWDDALFASVPEFRFDNKEHRLLMASKLLILLDEMGQYKKADIETLKAGLSQHQITADKKFQSSGDYPRIGSFAGCSNNENFLKDDTGDRRFWVFTLKKFDRERYELIPKAQLWGQLAQLYKDGEYYLPTIEEEAAVTARNDESFAADKPEDAFIDECLLITTDPADFIKATDMQGALDLFKHYKKAQSFLSVEVVRKKLQRLGVKASVKKWIVNKQYRGYEGVRLKMETLPGNIV
ncbi:hypothetical protein FNT36_18625 [Hymenobacter setariae]|uniref:Uncharacterized protein n=1 Tax=Hymenobacter setariae TaxID=2594794 RepID=A0A558BT14_9BACT|nr:VapE domain-containing protein [Hymenobacter setariae]TVT39657.1 hypothetical protein FNT36_18625 [Hymenobacter setariae]